MTPITHKRKLKNLESTLSDLLLLQAHYPSAFAPKGGAKVKPLKLKIAADIHADIDMERINLTHGQVRRVLGFWCSRKFYLKAIVSEEVRVDLNGTPAGPVAQEDKMVAKEKIEAISLNRMLNEGVLS
jgi:ProP effector